jgi:transcriptional regulator with XRE-family HTH domain
MTMNMSDRIRTMRLAKSLTQTEVAVACGVTKQAVCNWERGYTENIRLIPFWYLLNLFGIPTDPDSIEKFIQDDAKIAPRRAVR